MLRFLFGGLATVAGIVLLFIASFGDPAAVLARVDSAFSFGTPTRSPPAITPPPSEAPPGQPSPQPQIEAQIQLQPPPPAANPPPASPAPALPPAKAPPPAEPPDATAAMQARREALQQELKQLQSQMAQAEQSVAALRNQAAEEQQNLDTLQRLRVAQQDAVNQLHAEQARAAAIAAQAPPAPAEAAQSPKPAPAPPPPKPAPPQQTAAAQSTNSPPAAVPAGPAAQPTSLTAAAPQAVPEQLADAGPPLPLPPPVPPAPPPRPRVLSPPPQAIAANVEAPPVTSGAMPDADRRDQTDANVLQKVLDRLRQEDADAGSATPTNPRGQSQPQPEPRPQPQTTMRTPNRAPDRPAQVGPGQRLGLARSALLSGNVDAARQYLEEAQLQLVFHPVTPYAEEATSSSRVASDVASALSMLGAGDSSGALEYLDRAMAEVRPASEPAPRFYGYAGAYGGAQSGQ